MPNRIARLLLILLPAGAAAQAPKVAGELVWRLDGESAATSTGFERMPPGWHMTTKEKGGTLLAEGNTVQGRWAVEVELFVFPESGDAGLGVLLEQRFGGDSLPRQVSFQMRRDGSRRVVARHGTREMELVPWTRDTAITAHDGKEAVKYVLRVQQDGAAMAFAINGRQLLSVPTGEENPTLVPGLAVGPGLNLHVSRFDLVKPLAPKR